MRIHTALLLSHSAGLGAAGSSIPASGAPESGLQGCDQKCGTIGWEITAFIDLEFSLQSPSIMVHNQKHFPWFPLFLQMNCWKNTEREWQKKIGSKKPLFMLVLCFPKWIFFLSSPLSATWRIQNWHPFKRLRYLVPTPSPSDRSIVRREMLQLPKSKISGSRTSYATKNIFFFKKKEKKIKRGKPKAKGVHLFCIFFFDKTHQSWCHICLCKPSFSLCPIFRNGGILSTSPPYLDPQGPIIGVN
jgi:hypothetical protein